MTEHAFKLGQDFRNEEDTQAKLLVVADHHLKFKKIDKKS